MDYLSTEFGVDSSGHFLLEHRQTDTHINSVHLIILQLPFTFDVRVTACRGPVDFVVL